MKIILAALAFTLCPILARAQYTPAADVAVGYSLIQEVKTNGLTANGGSGSVAFNLNNWLGAVGDFGLYHSAPVAPGLAAGTYTFGPRFSYRHWGKVTPFAQALFGGVRFSNNGLAFGSGGGVDVGLDRGGRFTLRQQVEYFGFRANGSTTNTVRFCSSFVVRIGKRS